VEKLQNSGLGCSIAPLFWSQKEPTSRPAGVTPPKTHPRLFPSACAARNSTLLLYGLLFNAAPENTNEDDQGERRGRKDGNFPSFKPGVVVATTTLPPLSGLTSRKWRKDQKQVEMKRIKILKFFCFATGCHPSSTYRSARQAYSAQSKEK